MAGRQSDAVQLAFDAAIRREFPGLITILFEMRQLHVEKASEKLEQFKAETLLRLRATYALENLKDEPLLRVYRDFFWRVGIDPTKTRPASEALLRRVLQGKDIPLINTLVDSYNLASMESRVPLALFDASRVGGKMIMRIARAGEEFAGIGMEKAEVLTGREVVIEDGTRLVAIYPHRDADFSKVTLETHDIHGLACGVPGISAEHLERAKAVAIDYIARFCGGRQPAPV